MKKHLSSIISLTVICAVMAVLLALTNAITKPIIDENNNAAANAALLIVMPDGEGFEPVDISGKELPATVKEVFSEKNGGYVVKLETAGYSSGMIIMCGVGADGKVTGATCLGSGETLGYEKTYGEKTIGADASSIDSVDTIATATKTTLAYRNAVKDALNTAVILGGGEVDLRGEEEILNDNLSAALLSAEGKFKKEFVAVKLSTPDVTSVYKAENESGYVFVIGESFYGISKDGEAQGEMDEALKNSLANDVKALQNIQLTEIDITDKNLPAQIKKAYKTNSGSFVFELQAAGYGIYGDKYTASKEYIQIKASISGDGEIINCETTYQNESEGIGDACANESFYTQFNGKNAENYEEIDAIGGATITTNGYKTAISKVFEAADILKGGAN